MTSKHAKSLTNKGQKVRKIKTKPNENGVGNIRLLTFRVKKVLFHFPFKPNEMLLQ